MNEISKLEDIVRRWREDDLVELPTFMKRVGASGTRSSAPWRMSKGWTCFWIIVAAVVGFCLWLDEYGWEGVGGHGFEMGLILVFTLLGWLLSVLWLPIVIFMCFCLMVWAVRDL
jgi:hypothetical protein